MNQHTDHRKALAPEAASRGYPEGGGARRPFHQRVDAPWPSAGARSTASTSQLVTRPPRLRVVFTRHAARFPSAIVLLLALCCCLAPCTAQAAWPLENAYVQGGASPLVGFEERYRAPSGEEHGHCGVDLPASPGQGVLAPVAGTVCFVGAVPCDDTAGSETMLAVSIDRGDGSRVTLMPFEDVDVAEGQAVAEGQRLGTTSAQGDRSSSVAHLHLGLKRDGVYLNPMQLLGGWIPEPAEDDLPLGGAWAAEEPAGGVGELQGIVVEELPLPSRSLQVEGLPALGTLVANASEGALPAVDPGSDAVVQGEARLRTAITSGEAPSIPSRAAVPEEVPGPMEVAGCWIASCWRNVRSLLVATAAGLGVSPEIVSWAVCSCAGILSVGMAAFVARVMWRRARKVRAAGGLRQASVQAPDVSC